MVIIKNYKVKKLFNKFPEISGKIGINFRKFPEIFRGKFPEICELTTLAVTPSEKSSININRESTMRFPVSPR